MEHLSWRVWFMKRHKAAVEASRVREVPWVPWGG